MYFLIPFSLIILIAVVIFTGTVSGWLLGMVLFKDPCSEPDLRKYQRSKAGTENGTIHSLFFISPYTWYLQPG
jgi:hypothetical protein